MKLDKNIENKLIKLSKKYDFLLLILFGSRANNKNRVDSDWDFAFYTQKEINDNSKFNILNEIIDILNTEKIDLVNINKQDDPFIRNEIFKGICIFEKEKDLFKEVKIDVHFNYLDFLPNYQTIDKITENKLNKLLKISEGIK